MNFSFKRTSFTVIVGRTGAGKTTLIKVLLGLLVKNTGEIYWNGEKISDPRSFLVPPRIGNLPQVPRLFSDTIKNNILLGTNEKTAMNLQDALYTAVLEEDIHNFDSGIDTRIGSKGVKVSGGQRQRIALARMFVHNSEILAIDDLSNALDAQTEEKIWSRIRNLPDITCLVVSNRMSSIKNATQLILLKKGIIEAIGTLEKVLN